MSHNQPIQEILYFDSRCVMALFNLTPYKPPSTVIDRSHFRCWRMSAGSINKKCTSNHKVFQLPRISMPAASDLPWALENQVTIVNWIPMNHFLTQCQNILQSWHCLTYLPSHTPYGTIGPNDPCIMSLETWANCFHTWCVRNFKHIWQTECQSGCLISLFLSLGTGHSYSLTQL